MTRQPDKFELTRAAIVTRWHKNENFQQTGRPWLRVSASRSAWADKPPERVYVVPAEHDNNEAATEAEYRAAREFCTRYLPHAEIVLPGLHDGERTFWTWQDMRGRAK